MKTVQSKNGTTIAYDRTGRGPAVILVAGALSDRSGGTAVAALLAPRFTVFTYDRRGRGDSGDTAPYAVEREIEDMDAIIHAAGGSPYVMGHSSGAALALEAAAHGLAITMLALYEPPFIVDDTRPLPAEDYPARLKAAVAVGRNGDAVAMFMTEAVTAPAEMVAQMRTAPMWPAMERVAPTLLYDQAVMGDNMSGKPLVGKQWASVTMPTLVMDGGASPAWARNAAARTAVVAALPPQHRPPCAASAHWPQSRCC